MKTFPVWLSIALFAAAPSSASANAILDARVRTTDSEVQVVVEAREPIADSVRVRNDGDEIRIWFAEMNETSRITVPIRRHGIDYVKVRPGPGRTTVLRIGLHDGRLLPERAVRIDREDGHAVVRIDRGLLEGTAAPSAEAAPVATPSERVEEEPATVHAAPAPTPTARASAARTRTTAAPRRDPPRAGAPRLSIIAWACVALGLGYLVLHRLLTRAGRHPALDGIEVVAQKRIGTRHQLVVVRALGKDHLLSLQGDQVRRIASMPRKDADDRVAAASPDPSTGIFDRVRRRLGTNVHAAEATAAARDLPLPRVGTPGDFEALLAKTADLRDRERPTTTPRRAENDTGSDASPVATLLELRRQARA